jgi:hypothetical protein
VKKALHDIKKSYDDYFDDLEEWHRQKPDEFEMFLDSIRPK